MEWHIHGLVWAYRFLRSKNGKSSWGYGVLGQSSRENVSYLHSENLWNILKVPWINNFKSQNVWKVPKPITMYRTHRRRHLKIGNKNRWSHNMQTVLIAFRTKEIWLLFFKYDILKLNTLQSLDTTAMRTFYPSDDFVPISFKI